MFLRLLLSLSQSPKVIPKESMESEYLISSLVKCMETYIRSTNQSVSISSPANIDSISLHSASSVWNGNSMKVLVYALQCTLNITSHDPTLLSSFVWNDGLNHLQIILNRALDVGGPEEKAYGDAADNALHICLMLMKDARFSSLQQTQSLVPTLEKCIASEFTLTTVKTSAILCLANLSAGLSQSFDSSLLWNEDNVSSLMNLLYAVLRRDDVQGINYELYPVLKAFKGFVSTDNFMDTLGLSGTRTVITKLSKFLINYSNSGRSRYRGLSERIPGWMTGKTATSASRVHHDFCTPKLSDVNMHNSTDFTKATLVDAKLAEIDICIELLLLFCFYPENKEIVISMGIVPTLKALYAQELGWKNVASLYYSLKPSIIPSDVSNDSVENIDSTDDFQVMISYSWNDQSTVLKLKDMLAKHNIPYWIDVENMRGDVIDCMADAVESSTIVLCCISPSYVKSGPCRQEATFASSLNKPIIPVRIEELQFKGWIGVLMSSMLYYDVGPDLRNTQNVDALLSVIKEKYASRVPASVNSADSLPKEMKYASIDEVGEWLIQNNLENYVEVFKENNISGASLQVLAWNMLNRIKLFTEDQLMKTLREDLTMSLGDSLKFAKLLVKHFPK